jgi:hypothetical protein
MNSVSQGSHYLKKKKKLGRDSGFTPNEGKGFSAGVLASESNKGT